MDDNESTRWCLECTIQQSDEFQWVGAFGSGEEALREIPITVPHLILMDIRLPGISGIECMRRLKHTLPRLTVVIVSVVTDAGTMAEALVEGADGFLTKPFSVAQCLATLRFSTRERHFFADREPKLPIASDAFTAREAEVMGGLAKGLLYKEIADKLGISFSAVHKHQRKIFNKLHVSNRTEAIIKWRESQLPFR